MEETGFREGQSLLRNYRAKFAGHVRHIARSNPHDATSFTVELDDTYMNCRDYYLEILRKDMCNILKISYEHLKICRVRRGCVRVSFCVSLSILDDMFPLSLEKEEALRNLNYEGARVLRMIYGSSECIINA